MMHNSNMIQPRTSSDYGQDCSLEELVKSLERIVTGSEEDFLDLGMNLQKVQMLSSAQRKKIAATMGLFKDEEGGGILPQITSYVQNSQQETETAQQTAADLCTDLAGMIRLMDAIDQRTNALERAGLFLHVIGINTGIECARYDRMEAMFKVVSQDTIMLATQIHKATQTLLEQTAMAKNEQGKTLQGAQQSIESLQKLARHSKLATDSALGKVAELVEYSIAMVNEVEQMSVNITTEINRVVMGIQFHDNLRQRVEHVNEALSETENLPAAATDEERGNAYLSVVLQKAQLDTLVGELETLYQTQSRALGNILESVGHLESSLEKVASEQAQSQSSSPVEVLLTGISTLQHLNDESMALGREIRCSSERAAQIAGEMQAAIASTFEIANHVKINALNAIIKAAKFGGIGESLQVLAQGMVEVSKDTRQMVTVFNEQIEALNQLVKNENSANPDQGDQKSEPFDAQQVEAVFHSFRDELLASKHDCHSLAQSLAREQKHLEFIFTLKHGFAQYAEQLDSYAESIRPENEELLNRLRTNFGKQLEERYTMNEERDVHNQLHLVKKTESVAPQAGSTSVDDCLFFDEESSPPAASSNMELWGGVPVAAESASVELFDDPLPETATTSGNEPELWSAPPSEPAGTVELFDPPAESGFESDELWDEPIAEQKKAESEENKKAEDFGDNVELF